MASETNLDPRDRLAVMASMAGSYIESGRGDDALAVMRTVAEDVATEIARLTRELEEARMAARDARKEAVRLAVEQRDAAAENIRLAAELAEMRRLYADMTLERGRLRGALEEAREAITDAHDILADAPELNPSNYDHGEVVELNDAATEAYNRLARALATPPAEGDGEAGVKNRLTTTAAHQDSLQVDDGD